LRFSSADLATRKRYVALVESVKEHNGEVQIFSTLHVSGERKINLF
jgi:protein pelota